MKLPLLMLAGVALVAAPVAAGAQAAEGYIPAALVTQGANSTPLAGKGQVTVQVSVKKDNSFEVTKVLKSTNPGDNAAALEIAKSSKYKAAVKNGKPVDTFFDYVLTFNNSGISLGTDTGAGGGALALIKAGKYAQAKAQLNAQLAANPNDQQANLLLGVASSFTDDVATASSAFAKAGPIPQQYRTLAIQSYSKNANQLIDAQKYDDAIASANHAIDLDPNDLGSTYARGLGNLSKLNYKDALPDLLKARTLAIAAKVDDKTLATLEQNLFIAQLDSDQTADAQATAKDVLRLDPTQADQINKAELAAVINPAIALAKAGKRSEAVARLDAGATTYPANAGVFYSQAGFVLAGDKPVDWKAVKVQTDKAIAADPNNGSSLYLAGFAAASLGNNKDALAFLKRAKATPAYTSDANVAKQIDDAIKQLSSSSAANAVGAGG